MLIVIGVALTSGFMGNRRISGAALSDSLVGRPPRCHQGCLAGRATACYLAEPSDPG